MAGYPAEIRRCEHIRSNGTQCGSPALRKGRFCYHHQECRPERVKIRGADGKTSEILVPVFEDASSIQMMVRQVAMLLLQDKIDGNKAGRLLYALQIASANLKRMEEEKPRPVQVVVDPQKVKETPLGMTPWSARSGGHEIDEPAEMAAERRVRELDGYWRELHQNHKEWLEEEAQTVERWLEGKPDGEKLEGMLSALKTNMENEAETMEGEMGR